MSAASSSPSRSLRRNAVANVVGRSASVLLWVFVTPYVLARLGQERFAVWSLFLGLGGNVASLDLGMSNGVARYVALATARGDRDNLQLVLRRSLTISAGIGLLWSVACVVGSGLIVRMFHVPAVLESEVVSSLRVFAVSMFIYSITQVLNGALIGFQRLDLSNLCFLSGLALHAAVLIAGLALGAGLVSTALAAIGGYALNGLIAGFLVRRSARGIPVAETTDRVTWHEMLHFGGAVQGTSACAMGQQQAWNYLLGILGQLRWVTEFALGFRVANAVWSLPTLVQGAVIPAAAHASATGELAPVRRVYDWSCRWIFALAGFALAGLWLSAPALVMLWLGPRHGATLTGAVAVTRMLAIAFAVATFSGPATAVARGGGWPLLETWNFAAALAINLGLSLWLVPRFGPAGAAAAMAISYGLAGAWLIATLHRILGVPTLSWLLKLALPRFVIPAAIAVILWKFWPSAPPAGRIEALRIVAVQGAVFAVLTASLSWPTGDSAALLSRLRGLRGGLAAEGAP